jgi:hypothetical protein
MSSGLWREVVVLYCSLIQSICMFVSLITVTFSSMYTNNKTQETMGPTMKPFEVLESVISYSPDMYRSYDRNRFLF